jgi:hypothetical protein
MSPASYLTAPPRVATASIPDVDAFFWAALGFLVVAAAAGALFTGVRAWRAWRSFVSLTASVGEGVGQLLARAEELAAHGERSAVRVQELLRAVERLRTSQARAMILVGAAGELHDVLRVVRAFVPRR